MPQLQVGRVTGGQRYGPTTLSHLCRHHPRSPFQRWPHGGNAMQALWALGFPRLVSAGFGLRRAKSAILGPIATGRRPGPAPCTPAMDLWPWVAWWGAPMPSTSTPHGESRRSACVSRAAFSEASPPRKSGATNTPPPPFASGCSFQMNNFANGACATVPGFLNVRWG